MLGLCATHRFHVCALPILLLAFRTTGVASPATGGPEKNAGRLAGLHRRGPPDGEGMVGYNRGGFRSPEFQRGAMHYMVRSIVKGDRQGIDDAWRAIDVTFERQTEIGNFARDGGPVGGPSAVAFWLCELDQAILVLRESSFGPEYKERIEQLIPKIHKAANGSHSASTRNVWSAKTPMHRIACCSTPWLTACRACWPRIATCSNLAAASSTWP